MKAIESTSPDMALTTGESDLVSEFVGQVGFGPGETFTVAALPSGITLPSGNDAARTDAVGLRPGGRC